MNQYSKYFREEAESEFADGCHTVAHGYIKAADEIDRLTDENEELESNVKSCLRYIDILEDEIDDLEDEIDALEDESLWSMGN